MKHCIRFEQCSAPLCPLDDSLEERCWYSSECVCESRNHGKRRWVKKQRSIVKRKTKSWLNRPVTYQELFDASRPRKLTEAQRKRFVEMGRGHRFKKGD